MARARPVAGPRPLLLGALRRDRLPSLTLLATSQPLLSVALAVAAPALPPPDPALPVVIVPLTWSLAAGQAAPPAEGDQGEPLNEIVVGKG